MRCASCVWNRAHSTGDDAENLNSGLEGVCKGKEYEESVGENDAGGEGDGISRAKQKGRGEGRESGTTPHDKLCNAGRESCFSGQKKDGQHINDMGCTIRAIGSYVEQNRTEQ